MTDLEKDMLAALKKVQGYLQPVTHMGDVQMRDEIGEVVARAEAGYTQEMAERDMAERHRRDHTA